MDNRKHNIFFTTCAAVILFAILWTPVSALSEDSGNRFSFRFENCTVSDALGEISAKIGINITTKSILKKEILRKSYVNRRLDSIINDLLRGENCAVVWNYNEGSLLSIDLYTFDEDDVKRAGSAGINRSNRNSSLANRNTSEINQIRNRYLNADSSRSNRPNRSISSSRTSAERNNSGSTNTRSSGAYSTSARTNTSGNAGSDTSRVSANMRRATINNQNTQTNNNTSETDEVNNTESTPEEPEPEKGSGLERPPMPPGL